MAYQLSGNDEHFDGAADKYNRCCFLRSRWRGGIGSICHCGDLLFLCVVINVLTYVNQNRNHLAVLDFST